MENVLQLIRERRSVRSFDGSELTAQEKRALRSFADSIQNPWGRWVEFRLLSKEEDVLSSPVIKGETAYLAAKIAKVPHAEEALGFSFEMLMLYALSMGFGTVWLGGTLDRRAFERAMDLESGEIMPCVSPVGRPAEKMSLRETVMRRGTVATSRQSFSSLFFDGGFVKPLTEEAAGELREPLKAVQRAPSAVNRQPWRVVRCGKNVHFYVKHSFGLSSKATGDLQKIDLGIALCHFALAAEAVGLSLRFSIADPALPAPSDHEYIASYAIE
ncbi:MAG: nitroreductase [Oscillospiraceae bacterium]|nr:nitroreductase [Oscillospiraceae bacterium]